MNDLDREAKRRAARFVLQKLQAEYQIRSLSWDDERGRALDKAFLELIEEFKKRSEL